MSCFLFFFFFFFFVMRGIIDSENIKAKSETNKNYTIL